MYPPSIDCTSSGWFATTNGAELMANALYHAGKAVLTSSFCTAKTGLVCGTPAISFSGIPSATAMSGFMISAGRARSNRTGILVYNTNLAGTPVPFQGGTLCVDPMGMRRAGPTNSGGSGGGGAGPCTANPATCDGRFDIDMNAFGQGLWTVPDCAGNPAGTPADAPAAFLTVAGTTVHTQFWGRDSVATGSFVSDGLSYEVGP
jgi:hypothetical protein